MNVFLYCGAGGRIEEGERIRGENGKKKREVERREGRRGEKGKVRMR